MATSVVKWTREKNNRKTEFRDKTRRSHDQLKFTLSQEDKDKLLKTSDPSGKDDVVPQWEKRLAPAVAIGSSFHTNDLALKKKIERFEDDDGDDPLPLQKHNYKKKVYVNKTTSMNKSCRMNLSQIEDKPLFSLLTDCKLCPEDGANFEDLEENRKRLREIKNKINFGRKEIQVEKESRDDVRNVLKFQMKEKLDRKKKEALEKLVFDSKMYEDYLQSQLEEEDRKNRLKEKQKDYMAALNQLCAQKIENSRQEFQMKLNEGKNYELTNMLYEKYKENQMKEGIFKKQQLLQMIKDDKAARKRYEKERSEEDRREMERNYEYSIFKRAFGRKMRQYTKDKMIGK